MVRLKTRRSDWQQDYPDPYVFRSVLGTLIRGLYRRGLIQGRLDRDAQEMLMRECYRALTDPEAWWAEIPLVLHTGRTPQQAELDEKIKLAFHHLWTKAGTTHYVKKEWMELEGLLRGLGWRG